MAKKDGAAGSELAIALLRRFLEPRSAVEPADEGLRERKKRELRQRISDTATLMFLERGFDNVRVSEVAAACDVSEKTVFNYFPTKESLVFDQEERAAEQLRLALAEPSPGTTLIQAVLAVLEGDVAEIYDHWTSEVDPERALATMRDFADMIERTPALLAAFHGMLERLTQVAATVLAERIGVDPEDPEPQQAAVIVLGLWRRLYLAMIRHADSALSLDEFRAAVIEDLRRAASVAEGGLASFDLVVRPSSGPANLREAAAAADQARRQLVDAVKQAKDAWKQIAAELRAHAADEHGDPREQRARQQELRDEIRRLQREFRQQQVAARRNKRR